MMKAILLVLAIWHGANGLFMLLMPSLWYETVPGVTHTGPYNGHFIADIAIAFLACSAGLALAAFRSRPMAAAFLVGPAVFLGGHAVLHLTEFFHGHMGATDIGRDMFTILLPGLLPATLLWRNFEFKYSGEMT